MATSGSVRAGSPSRFCSDRRTHVYGGAFTAENQTGADRQEAADESGGHEIDSRRFRFTTGHRLDVLDAASLCEGHSSDDQYGKYGAQGHQEDRHEPPDVRNVMRPVHDRLTKFVGPDQTPTERAADKSDPDAGDRSE